MSKELSARAVLQQAAINSTHPFHNAILEFIQHHLDEIETSYWQKYFHTAQPSLIQVVEKLEFKSNTLPDDELDIEEMTYYENHLDFSLPDEISQYVICVVFEEDSIIDVCMES